MNIEVLKQKAQSDEGMTVEEIIAYEKAVKPVTQVYGKYGTLAKKYLEEHYSEYVNIETVFESGEYSN